MSGSQGTVALILGEIHKVFSPLAAGLRPEAAPGFFASLGVGMTSAQAASLASAFSNTLNDMENFVKVVEELIAASDATAEIEKGVETAVKLARVIADIPPLMNALSGLPSVTPAVISALPDRLFSLLLADYLGHSRGLNEALEFAGILERTDYNVDSTDPTKPFYTVNTFHFDRVGGWLSSPTQQLQSLYDWGSAAFDGKKLLQALDTFFAMLGLPVSYDDSGATPTLDLVGIEVVPKTTVTPKGLAITLKDKAAQSTLSFDGVDWTVTLTLEFGILAGTEIVVQPDGNVTVTPPGAATVAGKTNVAVVKQRDPSNPMVLLGQPGSSRLEVQKIELDLGADFSWAAGKANGAFSIGGALGGGKLVIGMDQADGFIGTLLSGVHVESDFDLGFGYSTDHGFYFVGAGSLEIQMPMHLDLGPIEISALTFSVGVKGQQFPVGLAVDLNASLGPLQAVVQQVGVEVDFALKNDRSGNAGPIDVSVGFKPPKGAGLSINTGLVTGGGYLSFDPDKGEYSGVAQLAIADIVTVTAISLITTKMPDGSSGFSLLLIITTDFPPLQLGFGFTLNAVGGLLGLNRSVLLDVLRDGVRTGAVDSIMFPSNVIANAPRIISDLKAVFPPQEGSFLVGPMAKFGWGTPSLITLSLGVVLEIPPGNIAILGVLKVALPDADLALIQIQVNFVGTLDVTQQLLAFDASLYDSHVLFMTLQGDMAVRLKWGDNAGFVLSVGGFHPSFTPPPGLNLPATMKRLTISILDYDWAKIKVDCYFAVTSNTVQFGAHLYLFFGVDEANISGQLGLDVLFQFSPFYFVALITGSLSISVFGCDLLSIDLRFQLSGPSPWRANGTGSISILFFTCNVSFDITWGDAKDTSLPPVDVMPIFLGELNKQENWRALPPPSSNLLVSLRQLDPSLLILHPFGALTVSQRALPLHLKLDKVGNQKPDDVNQVDIAGASSGAVSLSVSDADEQFAIAQFQDMSDAEKLSRPSYQPIKGGVTIGASTAIQSSKMTRRTIEYDITIIDHQPRKPLPLGAFYRGANVLFQPFLRGCAVARSPLSQQTKSQLRPYTDTVAVGAEGFTVSNVQDNTPFDAGSTFGSEAAARQYMHERLAATPSLAGAIHVLPACEVNAP